MSIGDFNLYSHFQEQFAKHADDELLCTEQDRSYTYSDIDQRSAQIARFLTDLGASTGDRVSVQVEKSPVSRAMTSPPPSVGTGRAVSSPGTGGVMKRET